MLQTLLSDAITTAFTTHTLEDVLQGIGIEEAIVANTEYLPCEQVMQFVKGHIRAMVQ